MAKTKTQPTISLFDAPVVASNANPFTSNTRDTRQLNLLAVDIATVTGWCMNDRSGRWDFSPNTGEHEASRLTRFRARLEKVFEEFNIKRVVYELPLIYVSKKRRPNFISFEMMGILKLMCIDYGIYCTGFQAGKLKKWATGHGNAVKEMMVEKCIDRYGITPQDHNEADAVHLYHYAIQELHL